MNAIGCTSGIQGPMRLIQKGLWCFLGASVLIQYCSGQLPVAIDPATQRVLVGEQAALDLSIDYAVTTDTRAYIHCHAHKGYFGLDFSGVLSSGSKELHLTSVIPVHFPDLSYSMGTYVCSSLSLYPKKGNVHDFTVNKPQATITVASSLGVDSPHAPIKPLSAEQHLTMLAHLQKLRGIAREYDAQTHGLADGQLPSAAKLRDLLNQARGTTAELDEQLRQEWFPQSSTLVSCEGRACVPGTEQLFFDDLYSEFDFAIKRLNYSSPKPMESLIVPVSYRFDGYSMAPNEMDIRLQRIENGLGLINYEVSALSNITKNDDFSFSVSITSTPSNAAVQYRRGANDFEDIGSKSDLPNVQFAYARHYTFRFTLAGYETATKTINLDDMSPPLPPISCGLTPVPKGNDNSGDGKCQ